MKLFDMLLVVTLILCVSGIASAANTTINLNDMIPMEDVKKSAMDNWKIMSEPGNLILGALLMIAIGSIVAGLFVGVYKVVWGKKSDNANTANDGMDYIKFAIGAAVALVIGLLVVGVVFGMI